MTTALATTSDAATKLLDKLQDLNAANAYIAAEAMTPIIERLAIEGHTTPDLDLARKNLETLHKVAVHPEKQRAADKTAAAAAAILTIVLDDTPQVAPPKRKRALTNVSDAIEIEAVPPPAEPAQAESWADI